VTLVLGGTLLATLMRCGVRDSMIAVRAVRHAFGRRFDAEPLRAALAVNVVDMRRDGLVRGRAQAVGDAALDAATAAMVGARSIAALIERHASDTEARAWMATIATTTLMTAAELAPVFGLFGTLVSLAMLPSNGIDRTGYMAAIGFAVHATMVGLLAANLLFAPLARKVERVALAEDDTRQGLIDWLAAQLAEAEPHLREHEAAEPARFPKLRDGTR
jgi:chemotaxis protein MotA